MDTKSIIDALTRIFERPDHRVAFAYLFGSTAKRETAPLSDVDVAVYLAGVRTEDFFDRKLSLHADICRALRRNDVDVVVLNMTRNLMLLDDIIRNGIVVRDADPDLRAEFELKVLHRAIDFKAHRLAVMGV